MKRTGDADLSMRLAFWGYTNSPGADVAVNLARQLRRFEDALDGRAETSKFFYEMPEPVTDLMALAVRGAGGPSHYDGGWDDLAAALPTADRGFEAIICHSADRLGRAFGRVLAKEQTRRQTWGRDPVGRPADSRPRGHRRPSNDSAAAMPSAVDARPRRHFRYFNPSPTAGRL